MNTAIDFDLSLRRRAAWTPVEVPPSFRRDDTRKALGFFLVAYALVPLVVGIVLGVTLVIIELGAHGGAAPETNLFATWARLPVELLLAFAIARLVAAASHALPPSLRVCSLALVALAAGSTLATAAGLGAGWTPPPWSSTIAAVVGAAMMAACTLLLRALLARRRRRGAAIVAAVVAGTHGLVAIAAALPVGALLFGLLTPATVAVARLVVGSALWLATSLLAWRLRGAIPASARPSPDAFD